LKRKLPTEEEKDRALVFVAHIEDHLKLIFKPEDNAKVICKICGKTIDEIYEEERA